MNEASELQGIGEERDGMKKPKKKHLTLRGTGDPSDVAIQYGSIYSTEFMSIS